MNVDSWLRIATADLPESVAQRIERDTREHLGDAGMAPGADVDLLLGPPEETAKEMKRLSLTEAELGKLTRTALDLDTVRLLSAVGAVLLVWLSFDKPSPAILTTTVLYFIGLGLTWQLPPLRQRYWLSQLPILLNVSFLTTYGAQFTGLPQVWVAALVAALVTWHIFASWRLDQKLRRTLQHLE